MNLWKSAGWTDRWIKPLIWMREPLDDASKNCGDSTQPCWKEIELFLFLGQGKQYFFVYLKGFLQS